MADVGDDARDGAPGLFGARRLREPDALADGVTGGKQRARGRLVHEHDRRRRARVGVGGQPAVAQRNAERLEVAGRDDEPVGRARTPAVDARPSLDVEAPVAGVDGQRQAARGAGHADAREGANARQQLAKERRDRGAVRVARLWQRNPRRQHAVADDARGDLRQAHEALHEQAGGDEQHDRDRRLAHDQQLADARSRRGATITRAGCRPGDVQGRDETKEHTGAAGQERRETEDRRAHLHVAQTRQG